MEQNKNPIKKLFCSQYLEILIKIYYRVIHFWTQPHLN